MKIIVVSMPSLHVSRWIENLEGQGHEIYWFDVLDRGEFDLPPNVTKVSGWKKRKLPAVKGEYFLSRRFPNAYAKIRGLLEVTASEALSNLIAKVKPDVVHSFEMQSCSYAIIKAMRAVPKLRWIYSCWGNDLFYYRDFPYHNRRIREVLKRVDVLHTDCLRDYEIAKQLGFSGLHTGVIPGGSGYHLGEMAVHKKPFAERDIILVKGYEHIFGRAINVVKALEILFLQSKLEKYAVCVFGAHEKVSEFINRQRLPFMVYGRHDLSHDELLQLMGRSAISIGNSISDGMANTLLEAVAMGTFPIQSNPGGVSEEIIDHGKNGFLISDPANIEEIAAHIEKALPDVPMRLSAEAINLQLAVERLDWEANKAKIIKIYEQ
ncbi:glycosyltransferase family 4 protein [Flavobacterium selenitireducens]|uniref:glycosyltransferase family 4 protein n=1 Tax=Flavobacterium selenitireducens TaxID=2722704 RepID=UPI00168A7A39|nr:glycosyltransferase family 4 protein [Flavobacterium selenitireducens]MBD3583439.1 glycosyltransferase family 4 protein [Flavobacterium selenitireducens]